MMMKPIKCKKLAVFRVLPAPRCSESPGVPFANTIHYHHSGLFFKRVMICAVLMAIVTTHYLSVPIIKGIAYGH